MEIPGEFNQRRCPLFRKATVCSAELKKAGLNGLTVDTFPSWTALGQGLPGTAWQKVHPDLPIADYLSLVNNTVERYRVDVLRVIEVVPPKESSYGSTGNVR
jgi:hypothetical protein